MRDAGYRAWEAMNISLQLSDGKAAWEFHGERVQAGPACGMGDRGQDTDEVHASEVGDEKGSPSLSPGNPRAFRLCGEERIPREPNRL